MNVTFCVSTAPVQLVVAGDWHENARLPCRHCRPPGQVCSAHHAELTADLEFPTPVLKSLAHPWRHGALIRILTWRDISGRYRGSLLGSFWSLLTPLLMLAVFTFVFGVVAPTRWPGAQEQGIGMFALRLLAGMVVHSLLSEVLSRAPTLVTAQPNYVTKVVFPLEVLGWVALLTGIFHAVMALVVLVLLDGMFGTGFSWTMLALPLQVDELGVEFALERVLVGIFRHRAHDHTANVVGKNFLHHLAKALTFAALVDFAAHAHLRREWHVDQEATGQRHLRGDPWTFGADRFFGDLHQDVLAALQQILDGADFTSATTSAAGAVVG